MARGSTGSEPPEWSMLTLYINNVDLVMSYDIIEVIRLSMSPGKKIVKKDSTGVSDKIIKSKEAFDADPYSMHLMNELAAQYAREGHLDKCCNVLMRGWKRASEIQDSKVRFHFLMKLCELSFIQGQYRQAFAVLKDIHDPPEGKECQVSYLVLSCKVHARSGNLQGALKALQQAIEPEEFSHAVRIWALVLVDFRACGGYEPARKYMEKKAGDDIMFKHNLEMLDGCATQTKNSSKTSLSQFGTTPYFAVAGGIILLLFIYLLYVLESWSLVSHGIAK